MTEQNKTKIFRQEFGISVRKQRHKLGFSQEKLAEKANVHRTYISSIELGKVEIGIGVACKVAEALNLSLSGLMKKVEDKI
jgi:transcriptional regulator with XRE-family HTH domain